MKINMQNKINISHKEKILSLYILLALITLAVYWQVRHFDFVNFDDLSYVTKNAHVQSGLTAEGIRWAFSTTSTDYLWHPLVWLSLMLDYQLYGLHPGAYHMTNLILHILSTLLLFSLFHRMTGALWKSAFVAAFFALHPLHVESVAWIAERKDVLSAFFWMLTLYLYAGYAENPSVKKHLLVLSAFVGALMSKPMVVTLPVVMILLDYWPLKRFESNKNNPWLWQLKEKWTLFVLSAVFSMITIYTQSNASAKDFPFGLRIANALISFVAYLEKTFWPHDLAVFYPFPHHIPVWQIIGSFALIIFISTIVIITLKRLSYLLTGWLWYIIVLLPVLGIIQSGEQAMADRYHYLPSIGIAIMVAWGLPDLIRSRIFRKKILLPAAIFFLAMISAMTWHQCRHWENSITLCKHTLQVTRNNYLAHHVLAYTLFAAGKTEETIVHFTAAIRLNPDYAIAYKARGLCYFKIGEYENAVMDFNEAIKHKSGDALIYHIRGTSNFKLGHKQEALADYSKALLLKNDYAEVYNDRAFVYLNQGREESGCMDARKGCELGDCRIFNEAQKRGFCR